MLHLLTQLQKILHLDYKTNITQNHQKFELYVSFTFKGLKKPHSSRWVGGAETWRRGGKAQSRGVTQSHGSGVERQQNGQSHIHMWWIKIKREISGARDPSPKQDNPAAQGSSARKINSHNFWL